MKRKYFILGILTAILIISIYFNVCKPDATKADNSSKIITNFCTAKNIIIASILSVLMLICILVIGITMRKNKNGRIRRNQK